MSLHGLQLLREWERKAKLNRPPCIPLVHTFAARMEGLSVEEMCSSPGTWSQSLLNCQRLFGYDGILVSFDPFLAGEVLGCELSYSGEHGLPMLTSHISLEEWLDEARITDVVAQGRLPVFLETVTRLRKMVQDPALCCSISGIQLLVRNVLGDQSYQSLQKDREGLIRAYQQAQKVILQWGKQVAESRPHLLIIREETMDTIDSGYLKQLYQPIINVVKYFQVPVIFHLSAGQDSPFPFVSSQETKHIKAVGQVLPMEFLAGEVDIEELESIWQAFYERQPNTFLLTTATELAWETDVDRFKDILDLVMNEY